MKFPELIVPKQYARTSSTRQFIKISTAKIEKILSQLSEKFFFKTGKRFLISQKMLLFEFKNLWTKKRVQYRNNDWHRISQIFSHSLQFAVNGVENGEIKKKKVERNFCAKDTTMRSELIWNSTANFFFCCCSQQSAKKEGN